MEFAFNSVKAVMTPTGPTLVGVFCLFSCRKTARRRKARDGLIGRGERFLKILTVAVGGAIGAVTRYLVSHWAAERFGAHFPYGTLIVNAAGCFFIGLFMTLTTERLIASPYWRLLVAVGFLGGLTTFSSFGYETLRLVKDANLLGAFQNIALNVILGLGATWLGIVAARTI